MKKEIFKQYWENGNLNYEYEHDGGNVYNGYYKVYYDNGQLHYKSHYKNDNEYGMCEWFDDSGIKYKEKLIIN